MIHWNRDFQKTGRQTDAFLGLEVTSTQDTQNSYCTLKTIGTFFRKNRPLHSVTDEILQWISIPPSYLPCSFKPFAFSSDCLMLQLQPEQFCLGTFSLPQAKHLMNFWS